MRVAVLACISLLGAVALPLSAYSAVQVSNEASNILPDDTRSTIAPALSAPAMSDNTSPLDFLNFARDAIAHRRTGEAQEAVKRTDARALVSTVPLFRTDKPVEDPLVTKIKQARIALGSNDIEHATQLTASASDMAAHLASAQ
jgi:hypothetical protein